MTRTKGSKNNKSINLTTKYKKVTKRLLEEKNSLREIAKLEGVSLSTVQRIKKELENNQ